MATLTLPDGRTIQMPDGLTSDQVKSIADAAMANPPAPPEPGMVRLKIGKRLVDVGESFLQMSRDEQNATVDEIAASIGELPQQSGAPTQSALVEKTDLQGEIPPNDLRTPAQRLAHKAKLGAQAVGQGVVADTIGLPQDFKNLVEYGVDQGVDLARRGLNATAVPLANKGLEAVGVETRVPEIPQLPSKAELQANLNRKAADDLAQYGFDQDMIDYFLSAEVPDSDDVGDAFSYLSRGIFGYQPAKPETSGERLGYNIGRMVSGAATAGGALRNVAKTAIKQGKTVAEMPALARPYAKTPNRAMAGDAAAAAGSATALHALDENASAWLKDSVLARFAAAIAGGSAGHNVTNLALAPKKAVETLADNLRDNTPVLRDPDTGVSPRRRNVNQAAEFIQHNATNPKAAAKTIAENQSYFEDAGGTMPTSGLMADDIGIAMLEKAIRNAEPKPFVERDKGLRTSAAQELAQVRPQNADPMAARGEARRLVSEKREAADSTLRAAEADQLAAQQAESALLDEIRPYSSGAPTASEDLDKVLVDTVIKPLQNRKNELFDAIDPEGTVMRPMQPISQLAQSILDTVARLPDSVRRQMVPEGMLNDIVESGKDGGALSFRDMNAMRRTVAGAERQAQQGSQFEMAKSLGTLKKGISEDTRALASDGSPAGQRAMDAHKFYEETFAPLLAQGEAGEFRKALNREGANRVTTAPTATAQRFLRPGSTGKEAAESLTRLLATSPDAAKGAEAARRYILADMAMTVGADGRISETSLRRWINQRQGMLSQVPAIKREVEGLLDEVVNRSQKTGAMRSAVEQAALGKARAQREIDKSALSLVIDADPKRAAEAVLGSKDPVGAVNELRKAFAGNVAAERGWRAAVSDYLVESLSTSGKAGIADEIDAVGLEKINSLFRRNEAALRTIFGDDIRFLNQARRRLDLLSNKTVTAARGNAVPKTGIAYRLRKPIDIVLRLAYGALEGGSKSRAYKLLSDQLPETTAAANDLLKRAMLDPDVARHLLELPTKPTDIATWNKKLNRLMGWADAGRSLGDDRQE